ncbi:MAG: hypothetical protein A2381_05820 [Bdellovibrionales bacterium RIFOXYB1_FULL_37_110]|nr:MAG: hypothetical protein A2417_04705 [Bdellovibrionales bacterium RIFOXYC1_FULL_37_79]OFZ59339.1 MAG: hypothetical protein A2381_05820 [Bdellovibrionales bacterium RIFOXYB1_FULL_37_110]OFZ61899.1 MAG: hypothetical protein A2577_17705 [Bdellovibrionales bacterium RIFOXYD1_FULL_36_51]
MKSLGYYFLIILFMLMLSACLDNGRGDRPKIQDYAQVDRSGDGYCKDYTEIAYETCTAECGEEYKVATPEEIEAEIAAYIKKYGDNDLEKEEGLRNNLTTIVNYAKGICLKIPSTRPSDQVYINPKYCACEKTKPYIINDCATYCATINDQTPTLYVTTTVGPLISANDELVDLKGWCSNDLTNSVNNHAPSCNLYLYDGLNTQPLEMEFTGNFSFKTDLSSIQKNKTYVATIVENQSKAKSKSFQIYAVDPDSQNEDNSPLKIMHISQYSCIYMYGDNAAPSTTNPTDLYSGNMTRMYFYYPSNTLPEILSGSLRRVFCHDINRYGRQDAKPYPRLELIPNSLSLWDKSDLRLYDADNNTKLDINEQIQRRLLNEYNVSSTINIFQPFTYNSYIESTTESNASELKFKSILQGYYMQPWIDSSSKLGYCPKQEQYHGSTAVFRILKELIGNDTEAIYFAKSDPKAYTDNNGLLVNVAGSTIIIRENVLKKIWFYYENNQKLIPNEIIAGQKTIMFYYPPDFDNPLVEKSHQSLFTVFNPTEDAQNTGDPRPNVLPPNKMFGCVPSLGDAPYLQSE